MYPLEPFDHLEILSRAPEDCMFTIAEVGLAREVLVAHIEAPEGVAVVTHPRVALCPDGQVVRGARLSCDFTGR